MKSRVYFLQYQYESEKKLYAMPVVADDFRMAVGKLILATHTNENPVLTGSIVQTQPFQECIT